MQSITRKPLIREAVTRILESYAQGGVPAAVSETNAQLLSKKVKFPLLEYAAMLLSEELPPEDRIPYCDGIATLKTIGGNVLIGILVQKEGLLHPGMAVQHAVNYTAHADAWYVCDIIGERVFGFLLLQHPETLLAEMNALAGHESNWVIRSMGAGAHYAIKKGLEREYVEHLFALLIRLSARGGSSEIRQGVGWAAKTTAKFHPDLIVSFRTAGHLNQVPGWLLTKIRIGLQRHAHAKGN